MRNIKEVEIGAGRIMVKELTLAEIRNWLADDEKPESRDVVGALLFDDCSIADLLRFCDAAPEQVEAMTQSELRELLGEAKRLNPELFQLRARLLRLISAGATGKSSSSAPSQT